MFNPFALCDPIRIELEFTTPRQRGLLLFNGAIDRKARYFISAQIFNSTVIVNIGSSNAITFNNIDVADKLWHKLDISIAKDVRLILKKVIFYFIFFFFKDFTSKSR